MSDAFQSPRGTLDWLPGPMRARRRVVERAREIFERAGYREVATPVFEDTGLFLRTSGVGSEVVQKEMYSFQDKGERPISLRPELTAPLMRAYLGHGMSRLMGRSPLSRKEYISFCTTSDPSPLVRRNSPVSSNTGVATSR